ncbi:hypothetical protein F0L68_33275 [Solihabitans fulvus]|uniref:TniQ domain-containing protein n=1 Tax=Solihabitans fulvus TaxID=1892852 RepID=A0A5B2WRM9_9PSEU|nr:hypothetical protein F0L68_33275 [Solihabitans fulvus]
MSPPWISRTSARCGRLRPGSGRLFTSTRACPRCLAESGGIWQLWWRLGIAAACIRHQMLLVDDCPTCALPLRRGHTNRGGDVPRRRTANPLLCGNSGPGVAEPDESGQCACRMDTVDTPAASAELVAVQRTVLAVALGASSSVVGATVTPWEWFHGLRFVAALHRMFAPVDFVRECEGMPPCAVEAFTETARRRSTRQALCSGMPPSAAHAAADLLLATPVLAAADPSECAELLLPVAQAEAELLATHVDRRDRMWTVDRPESLDRVWRAIRRSRHRGFDPAVRRVPRSRAAAELQVRHIPQLVDAADCVELVGPVVGVTEQTVRRMLSAACARLLGARSWQQATQWLEMPGHDGTVHQRASLILSQVTETALWDAATTVMGRLVERGQIDYQARRTALADLVEVPYELLAQIGVRHGMWTSPRQCRHAAAWIWAEITSGDLRDAPTYRCPAESHGDERTRASAARRRFLTRLTPGAARELRDYGIEVLVGKGVR